MIKPIDILTNQCYIDNNWCYVDYLAFFAGF